MWQYIVQPNRMTLCAESMLHECYKGTEGVDLEDQRWVLSGLLLQSLLKLHVLPLIVPPPVPAL